MDQRGYSLHIEILHLTCQYKMWLQEVVFIGLLKLASFFIHELDAQINMIEVISESR